MIFCRQCTRPNYPPPTPIHSLYFEDVAGIAAAIRSARPTWNPTEVRDAIVNSAALPTSGINLAVVDDIDCQPGRKLIRNRHV